MAIREGRCANCGSIIKVDDRSSEAVCMFCWAHTPAQEALAIARNPGDYQFPNEAQPEPDEESRKRAFVGSASAGRKSPEATKVSKAQPRKQKPGKLSPAEKGASMKKEIIEPRLEVKVKRALFAGVAALIVLVLVIALPLALTRDRHRQELASKIGAVYAAEQLEQGGYSFSGQKNRSLTLVLDREVNEEELKDLHSRYKKLRAEVYGEAEQDQQVQLEVYSKKGLYRVTRSAEVKQLSNH